MMLILLVVAIMSILTLLTLIASGTSLRRPSRHVAVRAEALSAEAQIDALTRLAIQQMRDAIRAELHERGGNRV